MPNLLITDDDMHLRKLVKTYGELEGFHCEEAETGNQALEIIESLSFDIIVLDVMMPGPDGFQVLEKIRRVSPVPVIMLTARDEEYDKLRCFDLGADDYLSKPFSPKELMARIKAVLRRTGKNQTESIAFGELSISPASRSVTFQGI